MHVLRMISANARAALARTPEITVKQPAQIAESVRGDAGAFTL